MGRKPKPRSLEILQGKPGKRPLRNEPEPDICIPDPPDFLEGEALAEWNRMAPQLEKLSLISEVDRTAFAAYCKLYTRWVEAEAELEQSNLLVKTTHGNVIQNPLVGIVNTALVNMLKYLTEFGMTPAARARVSIKKDNGGDGKWKNFPK